MQRIPLQAVPNQSFSVRLDGCVFDITIKDVRGVMAATIVRDGETVVSGVRCLPDTPLIPYRYLEGDAGNFAFITARGEYPHYTRFAATDALFYVSAEELAGLRGGYGKA